MSTSRLLDFVAVDFELANNQHASVCQVGATVVRGGQVAHVLDWPVLPPTGLDSFLEGHVALHKMTPQVAATGLTWAESDARLRRIVGGLPVVAHNASFDSSVYAQSCHAAGVAPADWDWYCTFEAAAARLPLERHRLPDVCSHLNIGMAQHHHAGADAWASAMIAIHLQLAGRSGVAADVPEVRTAVPRDSGSGMSQSEFLRRKSQNVKSSDLPTANPAAATDHPLHGQVVAITGDIDGYTRPEIFEAIALLGGTPANGVTKKTTALIVTDAEDGASHDLGRAVATGKEKKALKYRAAGQQIQIIGGPLMESWLRGLPRRP